MRENRNAVVVIDVRMARHSGIGVYIRNIVEALVDNKPHWNFRLLGSSLGLEVLLGRANVQFIPVAAAIYSIRQQFEMLSAIGNDADVVWSPHYDAAILTRRPLLVTIHDVIHLVSPTTISGWHRRLYARAMFEAVRYRSATLFFVSDFSRKEFERHVGRILCPYFITPNAAAPIWRAPRSKTKSPNERPYIIYVGNIKPNKNLGGLLDAFELIMSRQDVELVIVGKRDGFLHGDPTIDTKATKLGDRVRFTGQLTDELLMNWVSHARALVLPSLYEGFGIPPLEAMAVNCPAIVSDIESLRESCGCAAEFVDPRSPPDIARGIEKVLDDKNHADKLRALGKTRVEHFDFSASAQIVSEAMNMAMKKNLQ